MATSAARVSFRVIVGILLILLLFYVGRPLYWKISATVQEIRQNKRTVKQGISQIVLEAQKSVGWFHDESDSGLQEVGDAAAAGNRRILRQMFSSWILSLVFLDVLVLDFIAGYFDQKMQFIDRKEVQKHLLVIDSEKRNS